MTDRSMSGKTWNEIDKLLHNITRRAAAIKDDAIYRDADMCIALIRNLTMEIQMEDEKAEQGSS
jgi:hypothetical protein